MNLLYIYPLYLQSLGLQKKVEGQLSAFNQKYITRILYLGYQKNSSFVTKFLFFILYHLKVFFYSLKSDPIYYRFAPQYFFISGYLIVISYIKKVYIEHNTDMVSELNLVGHVRMASFVKIVLKWFRFSRCVHVAVTYDIKSKLVADGINEESIVVIQNGYKMPVFKEDEIDLMLVKQVKFIRSNYKTVAIFVGTDNPWMGLDQIINHLRGVESLCLLLVGPFQYDNRLDSVCHLGELNYSTLVCLYEFCDFGCGPFAVEKKNLFETCTLKVREYLFHGLPVLINHPDTASYIPELAPFIFNTSLNSQAVSEICCSTISKDDIKKLAKKHLSWDVLLNDI
jgi:glycosyltransferase involved in cell wall biosynthesis